ncbi:MAG: gamma-glutamyltransferase [Bryobacterales bacterium]|nr:gamma-glutamyltransferase [Bryobacterales bacterium]
MVRNRHIAWALVLGLLAACAGYTQIRRGRSDKERRQRQILSWHVMRPVVRGSQAAVAAGTQLVTQTAMRTLHSGGNAVDAGVAAVLAGAVTEFSHYGFGGEAPLLVRTADGQVHSIAGVGTAPARMTLDYFLSLEPDPALEAEAAQRDHRTGLIPSYGTLPALVPGMVDAALLALQEFGTLSFAEIARDAATLADEHPLDRTRARSVREAESFLRLFPTSMAVYAPEGRFPRPGDWLRQTDLAATIRSMMHEERAALAAGGSREDAIQAVRDFFYRGPIAREMADFVSENGGLLRYEDFASFRLEVERPLSTTFHGHEVYKADFWTQGAVLLQALNILEGYELAEMGWNTPEYLHHLVEALKLAFADRDAWYADPAFSDVPRELLGKDYAAARRALVHPRRSSTLFRPGVFGNRRPIHPAWRPGSKRPLPDPLASKDTTSVNIATADGMMFSASPSGAWMPAVIAGGTGIPLTQRAQSFLTIPDHPNVVEPGKRPRITLTPTLVTRRGEPFMALSTPGGDQQEQSLLQVLLAALLFGFNPQAAVEAPRFQSKHLVASFDDHAMEPNVLLVDERMPEFVLEDLARRGHLVELRDRRNSGSAPTAVKVLRNGVVEAGADPYAQRYAAAW